MTPRLRLTALLLLLMQEAAVPLVLIYPMPGEAVEQDLIAVEELVLQAMVSPGEMAEL